MGRYHGWQNWETWCASVYLSKNKRIYRQFVNCQSGRQVKELLATYIDTIDVKLELENVNYTELFDSLDTGRFS